MRKILFTHFLMFVNLFSATAQQEQQSRKEKRQVKQEEKKKEIRNLLKNKTYVFKPTHALPLGGGSIFLNHSYEAEIKGDTLISYLPFYGVAYRVEYGGRNSGFDFTQPIEEYNHKKDRKGYRVNFDVKNKIDHLNYSLQISEQGNATLVITSTNRQAITFYGHIEAPEENE